MESSVPGTGSSAVTVPASFSNATANAPIGVPISMGILGRPWSEAQLLNVALYVEELAHVRRMPTFANKSMETGMNSAISNVTSNAENIPAAYKIGRLKQGSMVDMYEGF